jgi:hypothetical protein
MLILELTLRCVKDVKDKLYEPLVFDHPFTDLTLTCGFAALGNNSQGDD